MLKPERATRRQSILIPCIPGINSCMGVSVLGSSIAIGFRLREGGQKRKEWDRRRPIFATAEYGSGRRGRASYDGGNILQCYCNPICNVDVYCNVPRSLQYILQCLRILAIYITMSQDLCNIYCNVSGSLQGIDYPVELAVYLKSAQTSSIYRHEGYYSLW